MAQQIKNFEELEIKMTEAGTKLIMVYFYDKTMDPEYEEYVAAYPEMMNLHANVDESMDLAAKYEVTTLPTFVFIKESKVIEQFSGTDYEKVKTTIVANM